MKKFNNVILKVSAILLIVATLMTGIDLTTVYADTPYKTYMMDGYNSIRETQTAYEAYKTLIKFDDEVICAPMDMCVTDNGYIYIADKGRADTDAKDDIDNSIAPRILVGTLDGEFVTAIGEGTLVSPHGVYVTDNNHVYVADRDAEAIFEFNMQGEVLNKYTKPTSPLYGEKTSFLPIKIVVNDAGIMYVVCESNTNGIVEISPTEGGTFLGYFGTNFASTDLWTIFRRAIATDAQKAQMVSNIPATPDNLAIDDRGLILTVTRGDEKTTLKRLNIAGKNLIEECPGYADIPAAVCAGQHDNIFVVDAQGYIYEYNTEGELLFVFGGLDDGSQRVGLSSMAAAIQTDTEDRIYVLDTDKKQIQVYEPTEFTNLLHEALYLYSKGLYTESKAPLAEVLAMNSMYDYANKAMGRAYFQEENYEMALHYARLAKDKQGYSDSYWEIRNQWLKDNLVTVLVIAVVLYVVYAVLKNLDKKKGIFNGVRKAWARAKENTVVSNLTYAGYFMKHPVDGSYGIAREGRASWIAPSIILGIFTIEFVIDKYLSGFLQKLMSGLREGRYEIGSDIGTVLLVVAGLTACNYLVCTINDGEGTVKKIYTYFCYSLTPYVILTPVNFALSHVVTVNEQFLITLTELIMYTWVLVLAVMAIKEVNNYTANETFKVIGLTLFTILIMALLIFIIYVLWAQVFEFVSAIYGEVVYRLGW